MILIYENVSKVLEEHFVNESPEFKKGAWTTLHMFRHGIKTHGQYNNELVIRDLNKQIIELKKINDKKDHQINVLNYRINSYMQDNDMSEHEAGNHLKSKARRAIKSLLINENISNDEKIKRLNLLTSNW